MGPQHTLQVYVNLFYEPWTYPNSLLWELVDM